MRYSYRTYNRDSYRKGCVLEFIALIVACVITFVIISGICTFFAGLQAVLLILK